MPYYDNFFAIRCTRNWEFENTEYPVYHHLPVWYSL